MASLCEMVVMVVGGASETVIEVSRRMVAEGAAVAIVHSGEAEPVRALVDELRGQGGTIVMIQADVSEPVAVNDAMDACFAELGRVDILVNVVGTASVGSFDAHAQDTFDRTFATHVRAPFFAAAKVATLMRPGGRIIIIGSIVEDRMPGPGGALYATCKSALGGMTRGLARDLRSRGITANLIQSEPIVSGPGLANDPDTRENLTSDGTRRHATTEGVAGLVAYLASPHTASLTGSTYNIDGTWAL